jgi:hypothetical protein
MSIEKRFDLFAESIGIERKELDGLRSLTHRKQYLLGFDYRATGDFIACPWLTFWLTETPARPEIVEGVLLMQDWWKYQQDRPTLRQNVDYLKEALSHRPDASDRTLNNLLTDHWRATIGEGRWVVSNAVWALRPQSQGATGELSAAVHRLVFRFWSRVVHHFANEDHFKLIVAGGWGKFERREPRLKYYLEGWRNWSRHDDGLSFDNTKGTVICHPHPSARAFARSKLDAILSDGAMRKAV